ncbi:MAG: DNA primase, partial [Alphaproteobacteria bacterium]|nr:DNA primase [Alphaproteobacteria bacterium]
MALSPAFLDELKQRLPVSEVVGKVVRLQRAGREHKGLCPFHAEKSPSFTVNDDKQFYHCFGCGAHGSVINFVMNHQQLGFVEAVEVLARQAGMAIPASTPAERQKDDDRQRLGKALEAAARWYHQQLYTAAGREALHYAHHRGLSDEVIAQYKLGYAPAEGKIFMQAMQQQGVALNDLLNLGLLKKSDDRDELYAFFRNRLMFPIGDRKGATVAFGARLLSGDGPKYINSPDHPLFHKGQLLYGLSRARMAAQQNQPLIIVEGYMDVIALQGAGYVGAVAPLGTALTATQLEEVWRLLPRAEDRALTIDHAPVLCFDGDAAGVRAAERAVERALPLITPAKTVRLMFLPEREDPDSLLRQRGKLAFQTLLDQAESLVDYLWRTTLSGRRLKTPEDRALWKSALGRLVGQVNDAALRDQYGQEFSARMAQHYASRSALSQARTGGAQGYGGKGYNMKENQIVINRPPPPPGQLMRDKAMLALVLHYPPLWAQHQEDVLLWECGDAQLEALRQCLVDFLGERGDEALDDPAFSSHLAGCVAGHRQAAVLSPLLQGLLASKPLCKTAAEAIRHWQGMVIKNRQARLQHDMLTAKNDYAATGDEIHMTRIVALHQELAILQAEETQL